MQITGDAQWATGAVGTYTVWTWAESAADSCGGNNGEVPAKLRGGASGCQPTGTAQLTCPQILGAGISENQAVALGPNAAPECGQLA